MQTLAYLTYTQSKYKPTRKIFTKNEDLDRQRKTRLPWGEVKLQAKNVKPKST